MYKLKIKNWKKACHAELKRSVGFTLIELLVVIAIIGVLSTIVLNSLSRSQAKAYDSKITQQLNGFRTASQMYFTNHSSYSDTEVTNNCGGTANTNVFNTTNALDGNPAALLDPANFPKATVLTCNSDSREYSLKATMYTLGDYWCVDNTGISEKVTGTPDNSTSCPIQ